MADPRDLPDERGEWLRLRNVGARPVALRGWMLASGGDRGHRIASDVVIPAGGAALLARSSEARADGATDVRTDGTTNAVPTALAYVYAGLILSNGDDWVVLRDGRGRTVDSVAWGSARRGVAMLRTELGGTAAGGARSGGTPAGGATPTGAQPLVVRMLDVGQGDAILVENGGSRALIDGGADPAALGRHLDRLGIDGDTVDVVVLTHPHLDHYNGLRELFRSRRRITVRYLFEARDPSANSTLTDLRDSIGARVRRRQLDARDADDPCGDGRPACTITLRGGARLQVWRPWPSDTAGPNNRSVAARLVSADSGFAMWLAGDAEHEAIAWMERSAYPMRADVLKADHHGSCDGVTASYLRRVAPSLVVLSLAARNDYGYVHAQTTALLRDAGIRWLRTDQNGTITITAPAPDGAPWRVAVERGVANARGPSDRRSRDDKCRE